MSWSDDRHWLHVMEANAIRAKYSAALVAQYVGHLTSRPDFETRAEDELAKAEEEIRLALSCIKTARAQFNQLPVSQAAE